MDDLEGFTRWMRARGMPEQHIDAHRHYAIELAKHPSLSAALRAEEEAGAAPNRLANLRQAAARIAEFQSGDAGLEIETAPPPPPRPAAAVQLPPRRGCECRERQDIYVDNDFGAAASMIGGGVGIGTFLLIRLIGVLGALSIALGLAGLGGLATFFSICFRCYGCRCTVRDLDADERSDLRKGRALVGLVTLGLLGGAALCAFLWWSAMTSRHRNDYNFDRSDIQQPATEAEPVAPDP